MNINEFVDRVSEQFDDATGLTAETKFRDVDGWSSIVGLSIIAMADEEYGVELSGDDVRSSQTIQDLYGKVLVKKG